MNGVRGIVVVLLARCGLPIDVCRVIYELRRADYERAYWRLMGRHYAVSDFHMFILRAPAGRSARAGYYFDEAVRHGTACRHLIVLGRLLHSHHDDTWDRDQRGLVPGVETLTKFALRWYVGNELFANEPPAAVLTGYERGRMLGDIMYADEPFYDALRRMGIYPHGGDATHNGVVDMAAAAWRAYWAAGRWTC